MISDDGFCGSLRIGMLGVFTSIFSVTEERTGE